MAFTNDEIMHSTYFFGRIVESESENSLLVNFLTKEKGGGAYCWPAKKLRESVYRHQIFYQDLHPYKTKKDGSQVFIEDQMFLDAFRRHAEELLVLELTSEVWKKI